MRMPTAARWMTDAEWSIVTSVFNASTLPFRIRIFLTNGLGAENRPFTIPTSLLSTIGLTLGGTLMAGPAGGALYGALGTLASALNTAYLMNVGPTGYEVGSDGKGMARTDELRELLVHETAHVWQGKNSTLSLSYVYGSAISQCIHGGDAYKVEPGLDWSSYNPEQQATLIERWYMAGESAAGTDRIWPYIRDKVRMGKT